MSRINNTLKRIEQRITAAKAEWVDGMMKLVMPAELYAQVQFPGPGRQQAQQWIVKNGYHIIEEEERSVMTLYGKPISEFRIAWKDSILTSVVRDLTSTEDKTNDKEDGPAD